MTTFTSGRLMSIDDVADFFGVHRKTVDRWCRVENDFPQKITFGVGTVRFLADEIEDYLRKSIERSDSAL
ncbi:MAG: helix-turn-helix domain-containing protein [Loktanella sp.]|nr:helix-turn-helix domain-containing protein [Loktanella sp.]